MDNLDKLSILVDKEWCQQALTNADEFEEALGVLVAALDDRAIPPTAIWAANRMAAAIRELHARLRTAQARLVSARILANEQRIYDDLLATAKSEGAAEAYDDIRAQAEDLRKEGGIRASLLRLLAEECVSSAAAIRKGIEAKEGK